MILTQEAISSPNNISLSTRETEVLFNMAKGMRNSEIADYLNVSQNTIRVHRRNLYCKLNVKKTAGAIMKGFQLGYLKI